MTDQQRFLAEVEHLAFYGLKRDGQGFAHDVLKGVRQHRPDLQITPVHPAADDIGGMAVVGTAKAILPRPDSAMIVLNKYKASEALEDAAGAEIRRIWLVMNACSRENVAYARSLGLQVLGGCPLLFVPDAGFPHNVHRWLAKLFGKL